MSLPGRPRDKQKTELIYLTVFRMLEEQSVRSITIEAIAKQAGVGKTTLYRWWPNKQLLMVDAVLDKLLMTTSMTDSMPPEDAMRKHFLSLVKFFTSREGQILLELLAEAQFDDELLAVIKNKIILPRRAVVKQLLKQGIDENYFIPQQDLEWLIDAIYGPIYYRALIQHEPLNKAFAKQHIAFWLQAMAA